MGVYLKGLSKRTFNTSIGEVAVSRMFGRQPTYRDMDNTRLMGQHSRFWTVAEKAQILHKERGVQYMIEGERPTEGARVYKIRGAVYSDVQIDNHLEVVGQLKKVGRSWNVVPA